MARGDGRGAQHPDDARMTFVEHLVELRRRLIVSLVAVAIAGAVVFAFFSPIIARLVDPYAEITGNDALIFTGPAEAFLTRLKVATYGGLILAAPIVLWQVWRFVTPALYPREKRYAVPFVLAATAAFVGGAYVAFLMLPRALRFLLGMGGDELEPLLGADRYLSFVSMMLIGIGTVFILPVLLVFLLLAGVVTTTQLRRARRWVIVLVFVVTALATPPDPQTQVMIAVPMCLFYEATILVGRLLERGGHVRARDT